MKTNFSSLLCVKDLHKVWNSSNQYFYFILGPQILAFSVNGFFNRIIQTHISVTLHYINEDFKCQNITLDIRRLANSFSIRTVYSLISKIISEWDILPKEEQEMYFITENSDILEDDILNEKKLIKIPCLYEIMSSSVTTAIAECEQYIDLLKKCNKVVDHFRNNFYDNEELEKLITPQEIIIETSTSNNWYSNLSLFKNLLQIRSSLRKIIRENSTYINYY